MPVRGGAHPAVLGEQRMHGRRDGHIRPEKALAADFDRAAVEDDEVEVGEEMLPDRRVASVIEAQGRLAGDVLAAAAEQFAQQLPPPFGLVLARIVVGAREPPRPRPQRGKLGVGRVVQLAREHLFALAAPLALPVQRVRHIVQPLERELLPQRVQLAVCHFIVMDCHGSSSRSPFLRGYPHHDHTTSARKRQADRTVSACG